MRASRRPAARRGQPFRPGAAVRHVLDERRYDIAGTLDVHIYDIARIESLSGPQGTLYGASSEAALSAHHQQAGAQRDSECQPRSHVAHGGEGGALEGMINLPLGNRVAFRGVAFYQRDAGFIDNIAGSRTYCGTKITAPNPDPPPATITIGCVHDGISVNNANLVEQNFNDLETYGGRAELKVDLDENWTATPTFMYQKAKSHGVFFHDPALATSRSTGSSRK